MEIWNKLRWMISLHGVFGQVFSQYNVRYYLFTELFTVMYICMTCYENKGALRINNLKYYALRTVAKKRNTKTSPTTDVTTDNRVKTSPTTALTPSPTCAPTPSPTCAPNTIAGKFGLCPTSYCRHSTSLSVWSLANHESLFYVKYYSHPCVIVFRSG